MAKYGFRVQYSFRLLLATCVVCGFLRVCFADPLREAIIALSDRNSVGATFRVTKTQTAGISPAWDSWDAMHAFYEDQFVEGEGFGLRRLVNFDAPEYRPIEINGKIYSVEALELISLNAGKQPQVYINTAGYPVRKHYKNRKTREPLPFEIAAVKQISRRQDVIFDGNAKTPRFVGAIRARKNCLQCHDARVGELLGAFSYRLR